MLTRAVRTVIAAVLAAGVTVALVTVHAASTTEHVATAPASVHETASPTPPRPGADSSVYAAAAATAQQLPIIDPAQQIPHYRRDDFGTPWADINGNSCRERDDLLARQLVDVVIADDGCTVLSGVLHDPYTGTTVVFQHDRVAEPGNPGSQGVQGDHIVSLAAAHRGGAWSWTDQQRLVFANSLENVIAVDGTANQSKQDRGPDSWLPHPGYVCGYVLQYTRILAAWRLAVDETDRHALVRELRNCSHDAAPPP